jgi:hypothetical protein
MPGGHPRRPGDLQFQHAAITRRSSKGARPSRARQDAMIKINMELPPEVARRFVEDMEAFYAEPNATKRDEIAARQLHAGSTEGRATPSLGFPT